MTYLSSLHPFAVWLRQSNWTARTLSEKLGVSRHAVYLWAAGKTCPTTNHLAALQRLTDNEIQLWMFATIK